MIYCKSCLTPSSRPRIKFDERGVCSACLIKKEKVDWTARRKEFLELIEPYKSKNGSWDCIVPWSGGKDSSMIAYRLKFEFGMNPLLVTFSPQLPTEVGVQNRETLINLGFDNLYFVPDQKVHRYLSKKFFIEKGDLKFAWTAGVNCFPVRIAKNLGIPLVFFAESEYDGKIHKTKSYVDALNYIGDNPMNWVDDKVSLKDLNPYIYPDSDDESFPKIFYFGYFFKWSLQDNYGYIKDKYDFKTHPKGRTPGTITNFDSLDDKSDYLYYYMQYIKFGFGKAVRDASRLIQNNHMTREEGLELCRKYDSEFPSYFLDDVLHYLGISKKELYEVIDKHRKPEIWNKEGDKWKLRYPLR